MFSMSRPRYSRRVCGIAALAASALLLTAGCGGGSANQNIGTPSSPAAPVADPTRTTGQYGALRFTLTTPKAVYATGELAPFTFTATNTSDREVTVIPSGPIFGFRVSQGNTVIWQSPSAGGGVYPPVVFAPGQTRTFEEALTQTQALPAPGMYQLHVYLGSSRVDGQSLPAEMLLGAAPLTITVQ